MVTLETFWNDALHWRRRHLVQQSSHAEVLQHVDESAKLAPRYAFMTLMSCGIATLGLLQNSAAVIIGAMLISPLMGPIIQLGISLTTFDWARARRALLALLSGVALTLGLAIAIVWLSPLKELTPEILARTEPTLFDLLVAIFSGFAGAYATITRKGETIVGVAIATALMPPLAVAGIGIALANAHVAGGAAFLFMTNLLAISLSATIMGRIYGFAGRDTPHQSALQAMLIIATFLLLSVPLGLALRKIAVRAHTEGSVRTALDEAASSVSGRIDTVRVDATVKPLLVDAVLMAPRHAPGVEARLRQSLHTTLERDVELHLREVLTTTDAAQTREQASLAELRRNVDALRGAADATRLGANAVHARKNASRDLLLGSVGTIESDAAGNPVRFRVRAESDIGLAGAQAMERAVRAGQQVSTFAVIPPLQPLLPIVFDADKVELSEQADRAAAIDAWALARWAAAGVTIESHAEPNGAKRAKVRAKTISDLLREQGIAVAGMTTVLSRHGRGSVGAPEYVELKLERAGTGGAESAADKVIVQH